MSALPSSKDVEAIYPLSPSQQGMLFESLAAITQGLHIEQSTIAWRGLLNLDIFVRSWQQVFDRHPILRTGFAWEGRSEPLQYVLRQVAAPVERHALELLSRDEGRERVDRYAAEQRQLGFNLKRAPLMRIAVFSLAKDLHYIVWTRHHILMDGWSLALVSREFMARYRAESRGDSLMLSPGPPFRGYIAWLRRQPLPASESFWRRYLAGFTDPTPLATKSAARGEAPALGRLDAALSTASTSALVALARESKVTISTLVQACWAVLLHHLSGANDVLFGATVSGRPADVPNVESMVGMFINSVPVRIRLSPPGGNTVRAWLRSIQDESAAQQPYSYCSSGQIHRWSSVPHGLPLYESLLVFQNYPAVGNENPAEEAFEIQDGNSVGAHTRYALTMLVFPGATLRVEAVYDTTRFDSGDVRHLLNHLLSLLERLPAAADAPLSQFTRCELPMPRVYRPATQRRAVEFAPPRTEVESRLAQMWERALGISGIGVNDSFFNLGGHSLVALRLMAEIQQGFGLNLPLGVLFQYPTVERLAERLSLGPADGAKTPSVVPMRSSGTKTPLFLVPGSGGNVLYLHELFRHLGADQPFYGLPSAGLDGEIAPLSSMEPIAARHIRAIQSVRPNGPYALGGHSFGGKVAFEIARQLIEAGETVSRLLILDTTAPEPRPHSKRSGWDHARWSFELVEVFCEMAGVENGLPYANLQCVEPESQLLLVKAELERLEILPARSHIGLVRGLFNVLKANMSVSYAPGAILPTRISLFRATEVLIAKEELDPEEAGLRKITDFGWSRFTSEPVEVVPVPGNHASMLTREHAAVLAAAIQNCLDEAAILSGSSDRRMAADSSGG